MKKAAKKKRPRPVIKNEKYRRSFYVGVFFLGLVSAIFEIFLYRKTFISENIPMLIAVGVGCMALIWTRTQYESAQWSDYFGGLLYNILAWGCLSAYLFMATNYYLADAGSRTYTFGITEKSAMPGPKGSRQKRKPLVRFDYFGFEKELVFRYSDTDRVQAADSVVITVRKGRLGFDILEQYDVVARKF